MADDALLRCEALTKRFGPHLALDGLSLDVCPGEFLALLGGSGSGKSTLLRLIAGFETPEAGRILLEGRDLAGVPPQARPLHMMFQSYALFPHMSVADNIAYGLRRAGRPREEVARRVAEALELVGLAGFGPRRPSELSGGQRQRVALARSLVMRPRLLLLDEPLGALDAGLRERTGFELRALQRATGAAFVMVTHDQQEALALSDRVAVLEQGRVVQLGPPAEVYEYPATRGVAAFLGSANLLEGVLGDDGAVDCTAAACHLQPEALPSGAGPGAPVAFALRPERIALVDSAPAANGAAGVVQEVAYRGGAWTLLVALPGGQLLRVARPAGTGPAPARGASVALSWPAVALVPLA
jgi:putrescine transport system ATP-binding protein